MTNVVPRALRVKYIKVFKMYKMSRVQIIGGYQFNIFSCFSTKKLLWVLIRSVSQKESFIWSYRSVLCKIVIFLPKYGRFGENIQYRTTVVIDVDNMQQPK